MAKTSFKKYIVKLVKSSESDFRYSFFRSLLFDSHGQGKDLNRETLTNPLLRGKLSNTMCPKKLDQLSNIRFCYNDKITDFEAIKYAFRLLEPYQEKINRYVELRKKYECAYLNQDYTTAFEYLGIIEAELGISLWSCGQKLMLKEQTLGLEGNKNELTSMCNCLSGGIIVFSILFFYSCMAERGLSYENYQTELMQSIGERKDTLTGRYLIGKLSFSDMYENKDVSLILQIDSQCSLIDLFISVEKYLPAVLYEYICNEEIPADLGIPQKIDANVFANLRMIMGVDDANVVSHINYNEEVLEIIEQYTLGNYDCVIKIATEYLRNNPSDLQIAILLCKSIICGEVEYPDDLGVQYVKAVCSIYALSDEYRDAVRDLKQTIKINHGSTLSQKVFALLKRKNFKTGDNNSAFVSSMLDPVLHPNFLRYFNCNSVISKLIADKESQYCPNAMLLAIANQSGTFDTNDLKLVVKEKREYLLANYLCKHENYDEVLSIADTIAQSYSENAYLRERLERIRLAAYTGKKDYFNAIKNIVAIFFENEYMFERLAHNGYCNLPRRIRNKELNADIDSVIYRYIMDPADYTKQIAAYCNFLDSNNYSNILDFAGTIDNQMSWEHRFFFERVCIINLLKHDVTLHTMGITAESARLQILQKLDAAFPSKKYKAEIQDLLTAEAVKENLNAINKSRIYADTAKIYNMHRDAWGEVFAKYLTLRDADTYYVDIDMMGQNKEELDALGIRFTTQERVNQATIVLKNMVNLILDECLFSTQYGLETHLSSRIRHGYCKGQLTKFLDDLHLLSKRRSEGSDEYIISEYWGDRIAQLSISNDIERSLAAFTKKIEDKIIEILTTWLRIKYKEGSVGYFEYVHLLDFCVSYYYDRNITSFPLFYNLIVDAFWAYTRQILDVIRNKIETDLKEFYLNAISDLEAELRQIQNTSDVVQEILSNCNLAKARVVPTMKQFADAFTLNNSSYNDFTMAELVASCRKVVERAHSGSEVVNWKHDADMLIMFSGKHFASFVDILSILLNNAIEHSGFEHYEDLEINISIAEVEDRTIEEINMIPDVACYRKILCMEVSNNLSDSIDVDLLAKNMNELFNNLTPTQIKASQIQSEGGSGLYKLYNIVTYNLESWCTLICDVYENTITIRYNFVADPLLAKEVCNENIIN